MIEFWNDRNESVRPNHHPWRCSSTELSGFLKLGLAKSSFCTHHVKKGPKFLDEHPIPVTRGSHLPIASYRQVGMKKRSGERNRPCKRSHAIQYQSKTLWSNESLQIPRKKTDISWGFIFGLTGLTIKYGDYSWDESSVMRFSNCLGVSSKMGMLSK